MKRKELQRLFDEKLEELITLHLELIQVEEEEFEHISAERQKRKSALKAFPAEIPTLESKHVSPNLTTDEGVEVPSGFIPESYPADGTWKDKVLYAVGIGHHLNTAIHKYLTQKAEDISLQMVQSTTSQLAGRKLLKKQRQGAYVLYYLDFVPTRKCTEEDVLKSLRELGRGTRNTIRINITRRLGFSILERTIRTLTENLEAADKIRRVPEEKGLIYEISDMRGRTGRSS